MKLLIVLILLLLSVSVYSLMLDKEIAIGLEYEALEYKPSLDAILGKKLQTLDAVVGLRLMAGDGFELAGFFEQKVGFFVADVEAGITIGNSISGMARILFGVRMENNEWKYPFLRGMFWSVKTGLDMRYGNTLWIGIPIVVEMGVLFF